MSYLTSTRSALLSLGAAIVLMSCAGQRAPEGGPIDTEPPIVVAANPANYTTHFDGQIITVEFSKYVNHGTVEGAIFTSPSLGHLEFEWSGREVDIRFSEKLRRNTTYVITVGTDVADIRANNKMAQAYTLAFSTGDDIDHGAVRGKVFPPKDADSPQGIMVFAYNTSAMKSDTLNPETTKPDYVTQTGKNGEFLLQHLSFGTYRVLAVKDEYKNLLYDPEVDQYGVFSGDLALTPSDTLRSDVLMKLAKEDTTALRLVKATATNKQHLVLEFSAQVDTSTIKSSWFSIVDTLKQSSLGVTSVCPVYPKLVSILLTTGTQSPQAGYRIHVDSLRSAGGLGMSPVASTLTFTGSELKDSVGPGISSFSVADSSRDVDLQPTLFLHFSDVVQKVRAERSIALIDSGRKAIPLVFRWLSDASVEIVPAYKLVSRVPYALNVTLRDIPDHSGRMGKDSLRVFRFRAVDDELFSSIQGTITDLNEKDAGGELYVVARNIAQRPPKEYVRPAAQNGSFRLTDIMEGAYVLSAFRDRNGNGAYDVGRPFPFHPSERFAFYPDTLKVRARWPLEGVQLNLK